MTRPFTFQARGLCIPIPIVFAGTAYGQLSTASINGCVHDSSGAAVLRAEIVLQHIATGVEGQSLNRRSKPGKWPAFEV
jgi:hypothetical protein